MTLVDRINNTLKNNFLAYLQEWLPDGRIEGNEYVALNPTRADSAHGSFKINLRTFVFKDHSLSDKGGNDPIALYAYIKQIDMSAAVKTLAKSLNNQIGTQSKAQPPPKVPKRPADTWVPIIPVPSRAPAPPNVINRQISGKWHNMEVVGRWPYRNANGDLIGFACRIQLPDGGKDVMPQTYCRNEESGEDSWRWRGFDVPRPVYGLDLLYKNPTLPVMIVEGEKTADAARQLCNFAVVITWPGGSKAIEKIDWEVIKGRRVIIWPDADRAGLEAAYGHIDKQDYYHPGIGSILMSSVAAIKIVRPPAAVATGWDLADALAEGWTPDRVKEYVTDNAFKYEPKTPDEAAAIIRAGFKEPDPKEELPVDSEDSKTKPRLNTIQIYKRLPENNDKGKPLATIENVQEILFRLGVTSRYNVISKEEEILIPGQEFSIDNKANASFAWLLSWCGRLNMPTDKLGDFLTYLSDQNLYNPVANWVTGKEWDKTSRIKDFLNTVTAVGEEEDPKIGQLKDTLIKRWMISAIAAAFEPRGISAHGVLVFQGDQYLGKTAWFKRLVPPELGLLADGMTLKPDDKDSVKQVVSHWLVELGELDATFKKSDIAQLKSFITRDRDILRRAYARKESEYARRTIFFASVNPKQFLHDSTGNRRFWTIECAALDHHHNLDMQQIWAEFYEEYYLKNHQWYLSGEEMNLLNEHNEGFESKDPIEERIIQDLKWEADQITWLYKSATEVLMEMGIDKPTQSEKNKASAAIFKMNGNQKKKTGGLTKLRCPPIRYQAGSLPPVENWWENKGTTNA